MKDFIFGFSSFIILYLFAFVAVFGTKSLLVYLKILPLKSQSPVKKTKKAKTRQPIRSITINPNDVDRIYVKRNTPNSD